MKKRHQKELDNEMFLYENFLRKDYLYIAVREKEAYFKAKYPHCEIVQKRNKNGIRVIVYEKGTY